MRHALMALIFAAALVCGCTGHKVTVDSNGTTVTTSGDNADQTVTVQSKEGSAVVGKGAVDAANAAVGLPVYPGANASQTTAYTGTNTQNGGSGAAIQLSTKDTFDKVYSWYKGQLPAGSERMKTSSGNGEMAVFQVGKEGDKTQKVVTIMGTTDGTTIQLMSGTNK